MSASENTRIKIELSSTQETLLIALWCRAKESQKERPLLLDPKASEIVRRLDYDFGRIDRTMSEYIVLVSNVCSRYCDDAIKAFIANHPRATVVNIGAGLDTTFYRVDNGSLKWYDLDLPDVIDLRRRLLPETDRSRCIAKSAFDFTWFDDIAAPTDGLFMISHGVLPYLDPADVRRLFSSLTARFPGAELIFNYFNAVGKRGANRLAVKRSGIKDAAIKWSVASPGNWPGGTAASKSSTHGRSSAAFPGIPRGNRTPS